MSWYQYESEIRFDKVDVRSQIRSMFHKQQTINEANGVPFDVIEWLKEIIIELEEE